MLARAMNKHFQFSNNVTLLKTVVPLSYQRIKLYNYIIVAIRCYMVLSYRNA